MHKPCSSMVAVGERYEGWHSSVLLQTVWPTLIAVQHGRVPHM